MRAKAMKTKINFSFSIGKQYFFSTVLLLIFITILYQIQNVIGHETVSLILLLLIFLLPLFNFDKGPIILSAVISALAWDYYFIPPHFTMHIARTEDVVMLFLFFFVAVTNGVLTSRLKEQKNNIAEKERRFSTLYILLKDLSGAKDLKDTLSKIVNNIQKAFGYKTIIYFADNGEKLNEKPHNSSNFEPDSMEWLAAEAAFKEKTEAGKMTSLARGADAIYFPLMLNDSFLCVIGVKLSDELKYNMAEIEFLRNFIKELPQFIVRFLD
jgi:two-component system, OmpR family, sensor histidine kinase KdpD